jgi:hypothetical protein
MRNLKTLIGFTALVAVIILALGSCIINVPDDKEDTNTSINGTWRLGDGTTRITISGSTGSVSQVGNSWSVLGQNAVDKGYVKVGTTFIRYISKDNNRERTWTGQRLMFEYNTSAPNVCTGTAWSDTGTITMDSNGKSFVFSYTTSGSGTFTNTFYRD